MEIKTKRLKIVPLFPDVFSALLNDPRQIEKSMGLDEGHIVFEGDALEEVMKQYSVLKTDPDRYPWVTLWVIISKESNGIVGYAFFKTAPQAGEVEVRFRINEDQRRKGYMTEALGAVSGWAFSYREVRRVVAVTDEDNKPAKCVLEKNSFKKIRVGAAHVTYAKDCPKVYWLPICMCLGMLLGSIIGNKVFGQYTDGMMVGLAAGLAIGFAMDKLVRRR